MLFKQMDLENASLIFLKKKTNVTYSFNTISYFELLFRTKHLSYAKKNLNTILRQ